MEEQLLAYFNSLDDTQKQALLSTFQNTTEGVGTGPISQTLGSVPPAPDQQGGRNIDFKTNTGQVNPAISNNPLHQQFPGGVGDAGFGGDKNFGANPMFMQKNRDTGEIQTDPRLASEAAQMNLSEPKGVADINASTDDVADTGGISSEGMGNIAAATGAVQNITSGGQGQNQGWEADANKQIQSSGDILGGSANTFMNTFKSTGNPWIAGGAALIKGASDVIGRNSDQRTKERGTEQVRYQNEMAAESMSPYADRHSVYYQGNDLDYYG